MPPSADFRDGEATSVKDKAAYSARSVFDRVPPDRREAVAKVVLDVLRHEDGKAVLELISNCAQQQDQQTGPMRYLNCNSILEGFTEVCQSEVVSPPGDGDLHMADEGEDEHGDHQDHQDDDEYQDDEYPLDDAIYYGRDDPNDEDYVEGEHGQKANNDNPNPAGHRAKPVAGLPEDLVQAASFAISTQCPATVTVKIAANFYERLLHEPFGERLRGNAPSGPMQPEQALRFTILIVTAIRQLPQAIFRVSASVSPEAGEMPRRFETVVAKLRQSGGLDSVKRLIAAYGRSYDSLTKMRTRPKKSGREGILDLHALCELGRHWDQIYHEVGTASGKPVNKEMHDWAKTGSKDIGPRSKDIRDGAKAAIVKDLQINRYHWNFLLRNSWFSAEANRRFGLGGMLLVLDLPSWPYRHVGFRIGRIMHILLEVDEEYQHPIKNLLVMLGREIVEPVIGHRALPQLVPCESEGSSVHQLFESMGLAVGENIL